MRQSINNIHLSESRSFNMIAGKSFSGDQKSPQSQGFNVHQGFSGGSNLDIQGSQSSDLMEARAPTLNHSKDSQSPRMDTDHQQLPFANYHKHITDSDEQMLASQDSHLRDLMDRTTKTNSEMQGLFISSSVSKKKVCMVYHVAKVRSHIEDLQLADPKDLEFERRKELSVSLRQLLRSELFLIDWSELETYREGLEDFDDDV